MSFVLFAGATKDLQSRNWPVTLGSYETSYLLNTLYTSAVPGIAWYVVVLVPADIEVASLNIDNRLYNVVVALAATALSVSCVYMRTVLFYRDKRLLKLAQPVLIMFVIFGNILLCIHCLLLLGPNTVITCAVRPFLFNVACTFTFAQFFIKATRVYDIFIAHPMQKNKTIRTTQLVIKAMYLVLIDIALMAITLYTSNGTSPIVANEKAPNGAYLNVTYCAYTRNNAFFYSEILYKSILMLITCAVSFRIRNVPGLVAGSKVLIMVVYNTAFISLVVILITQITAQDVPLTLTIEAAGISFCAVVNGSLLVLPLMYQLYTIGDDAAADNVMEELFNKKTPTSDSYSRSKGNLSAKISSKIHSLIESRPISEIRYDARKKPTAAPISPMPSLVALGE